MRNGVRVAGGSAAAAILFSVAQAQAPPLTFGNVDASRMLTSSSYWTPSRAVAERVEGWAEVTCQVTPTGNLKQCEVTGEDPVGYGFGAALAKQAQAEIRLSRRARDGTPVGGRTFRVGRYYRFGGTLPKTAVAVDRGAVRDDGLLQRWMQFPDLRTIALCFKKAVGDPETATVALNCKTAPDDRLAECRVVSNSRAPDLRYEAGGACAAEASRIRVSRPDGSAAIGADVAVRFTYDVR